MDPALKNIFRIGKVLEYPLDPTKHLARVVFEDKPTTMSYWLPPLVMFSLKNNDYWMPDIGEAVLCLFLPNGNGQGFIVASYHKRENSDSPVRTEERRHIRYTKYEDGAFFEYDRKKHALTIDLSDVPDVPIITIRAQKPGGKIVLEADQIIINGQVF